MPLQQLVNAITLGSTYSLVALGYTLIFGTLGIVNMAHGDVFMAAAFAGLFLVNVLGFNIWVALVGAMVAGALLGLILEYAALRPMRRRPDISRLSSLISTIGFGILLQNIFLTYLGPESRTFDHSFQSSAWSLGPITVTPSDLMIITVSLVIMVGLHLGLNRTKVGKALRAVSENPEASSLLGVNAQSINLVAVALASAIGGAAGMLVGIAFAVHPIMGLPYGLKGLSIIVLGGMGSVPGAMIGGLILGLIEVMTVQFLASSWRDAAAFALLFVLLVVRPGGLFGQPYSRGRA